jgi:hypothetical protein
MPDVTQILSAIEQGDPNPAAELLPLVHDELRKLAAARPADEKPGQTLQVTAVEAMRRILIDRARAARCEKRGGRLRRLDVDAVDVAVTAAPDDLLRIDEAIARLAARDATAARY